MNQEFQNITIRHATPDDAWDVVRVHFDSVHHVAAKDYPVEILNEWSPPVSEERVRKFLNNGADVKLVAQVNGDVVGFGELLTDKNQLGAVYVASSAVGRGVGKSIMACLEDIAKQKNVTFLEMESSVTAFPFYQKLGYVTVKHSLHRLGNGLEMACIKMRKDF